MRRDNIGFHPKAQQETHQRGREVAATGTAHKARIVIKGEQRRQAMLAEKLGDHFQQGLGIELSPDLPMQPDGGACVHEVGHLHHMLSLPLRISRHTACIFEIELDFLTWLPQLEKLGLATTILGNTARLAQDLPDRCLGARQAQAGVFERGIVVQVGT